MYKCILIVLFATCFICCSTPTYELNSEKTENHLLVGYGIYMNLPFDFKKASSYKGYQLRDKSASVSVKTSEESLQDVLNHYTSKSFKRSNLKALEHLNVNYQDSLEGIIFTYLDKRSKYISKNVVFPQEDNTTLKINFLYHSSRKGEYEKMTNRMLNSIYLDNDNDRASNDDEPYKRVVKTKIIEKKWSLYDRF